MGRHDFPGTGPRGLSPRRGTKISLVVLCVSVALFVHAYVRGYPLTQTASRGYISQVPLSFWAGIVLATLSLVVLALCARTIYAVPVLLWLFYLVYHARQLLYYNLLMSDNSSISGWNHVLGQLTSLPTPDSPAYFDYLQWPIHHLLTMVIQRIGETGIMATMEVGFVAYLSIFSIGVFFFTYVYTQDRIPFYLFAGGCLYLVVASYSLNNQFVPQFLALTILTFLVPCHSKAGTRWISLRLLLFVALVMAHPFIYIFYLVAFFFSPFFTAAKQTLAGHVDPNASVLAALGSVARSPLAVSTTWLGASVREFRSSRWLTWAVTIASVYAAFLVYRFVSFQLTVFYKITRSEPDVSRTPFGILVELVPGPIRSALPFLQESATSSTSSSTTVLLYDLVPEGIHPITRNGAIFVVISVFLFLLVSQLYQRVRQTSPLNVSLATAGGLYFLVGGFLPLLANRALQVVFLPMITAMDALRSRPVLSRFVVAVLLVTSPIILANGLVNQSITGGGNTEDFHTTRAGLELADTATQQVIVHHENSRPLKSRSQVTSIQDVIGGEYSPSPGDLVVTAPVVDQYVRYHNYRCSIDPPRQNVVYDNQATGMLVRDGAPPVACAGAG